MDGGGHPRLVEVPEPASPAMRVLACGLCGSDVEKLGAAPAGTVLGHEVVARARDGRRLALIHHLPCGECERCLAGHESTCESFAAATIVPGGFAELVGEARGVPVPDELSDAVGTYIEPLACVLRGAERVPRGRVLVVGQGFVGRLFAEVLRRRGDDVYAIDTNPERSGRAPDGPVDAAVLCAPAAPLELVSPGGTVLVFADAGTIDAAAVYRRELTLTGSRSATPRHMEEAAALLQELDLPEPTVLPLEQFSEGCRALPVGPRAQGRLHAVRALLFHGPGDLRLEEVPRPEPGPGDVLVRVEVALTDGTDLKAFRRGHPVLLGELPSPFGHEFCGIDVETERRVVAANSAGGRRARRRSRAAERRLRRVHPRSRGDREREFAARPCRARARGRRPGRAARLLPARSRARGRREGRLGRDPRRGADRLAALRVRRRRGRAAGRRRRPSRAPRARAALRRRDRRRGTRRHRDRGGRDRRRLGSAQSSSSGRAAQRSSSAGSSGARSYAWTPSASTTRS